jgi:hypothetical protein
VYKVQQETREQLVQPVLKGHKVQQVLQGLQDLQDLQGLKEFKEYQDPQVRQGQLVLLA